MKAVVIAPLYRTGHQLNEESTPPLPMLPNPKGNGSINPAMVPLRLPRLLPSL